MTHEMLNSFLRISRKKMSGTDKRWAVAAVRLETVGLASSWKAHSDTVADGADRQPVAES